MAGRALLLTMYALLALAACVATAEAVCPPIQTKAEAGPAMVPDEDDQDASD